jgi:HK97 family phage major capsid protein
VADANSPADYLFTLVGKLKKNYLQGANWFFPRAVQAKIRKFKTTALGYIWEPSLKAGEPSQLLGYPVDLSEDMPALAASSLSLAFGNFAEAYTIVDRMGIRMIRDAVTAKGHVIFYVTKRSGGGMVNSEAYKLMKFIN